MVLRMWMFFNQLNYKITNGLPSQIMELMDLLSAKQPYIPTLGMFIKTKGVVVHVYVHIARFSTGA